MSKSVEEKKEIKDMPWFGRGFVFEPERYQDVLGELMAARDFMLLDRTIRTDGGKAYKAPRMGIASRRLESTPIFVFDRPDLVPILGDTMSTDMSHIFVYLPFLEQLLDVKKNEAGTYPVETVLAHEVGHIVLGHQLRFAVLDEKYSHDDKNIAGDLEINISHVRDFESEYPVSEFLKDFGWGYSQEHIARWSKKTLEEIIEDVHQDRLKKQNNTPNQQAGGPGAGQSMPGKGQPNTSNNPSNGDGEPAPGGGQPGGPGQEDKGKSSSNNIDDVKNLEDILKKISELGDDSLLEGLKRGGMIENADMDDLKKGEISEDLHRRIEQKMDTSEAASRKVMDDMSDLSEKLGGHLPGAHSYNTMKQVARARDNADVAWYGAVGQMIKKRSQEYKTDMKKRHDICYFRGKDMKLNRRLGFIPGKSMHKREVNVRVLIDTSGSMDINSDLVDVASELSGLVDGLKANLYYYCIDTVTRHEYPYLMTKADINKLRENGMDMLGRGGTSLENGLRMVMDRDAGQDIQNAISFGAGKSGGGGRDSGFRSKSFGSGFKSGQDEFGLTVYITDFGDGAPNYDNFTAKERKDVIFLGTTSATLNDIYRFRDAGWAAHKIKKGLSIDVRNNKVEAAQP